MPMVAIPSCRLEPKTEHPRWRPDCAASGTSLKRVSAQRLLLRGKACGCVLGRVGMALHHKLLSYSWRKRGVA
ncbi:hypothetical protein LMG28727_07528 [Paraburkholderia kirstenboschensis]|nr:hypothetical protein LMG28727_07528 [Paraburkholderia kirstenboschensis]